MALGHHLSVDSWIERTAAPAKLVIVRLLGGRGYWPMGSTSWWRWRSAARSKLAPLPGGRDP
jgi:cobaltochelatase CobN